MAPSSSSMLPKTTQAKRLSELLEEEQEPFVLHEYLSERGYSKRSQNCDGGVTSSGNCSYSKEKSSKDLKMLSNYELSNRRKKNKHYPSKVLRSVLNKLFTSVYHHDNRKSTPPGNNNYNTRSNEDLDNRFSSASSMTLFESSSEADTEELSSELLYPETSTLTPSSADTYKHELHNLTQQAQNEIPARLVHQLGCLEETKQHSPVSVLEELLFDKVQSSPRTSKKKIKSNVIRQEKSVITDESIFSASLWESLVHTLIEKQGSSSNCSQYLKTKRVLEKTKQLLFDCVRETIENYTNHGGKIVSTSDSVRVHCGHERVLLGGEDIGKILSEKICLWVKQSGNITNITQLVNSEFHVSKTEEEYWKETPQAQIRESIGIDIGDEILEDIKNEIVIDMIENFEISKY